MKIIKLLIQLKNKNKNKNKQLILKILIFLNLKKILNLKNYNKKIIIN